MIHQDKVNVDSTNWSFPGWISGVTVNKAASSPSTQTSFTTPAQAPWSTSKPTTRAGACSSKPDKVDRDPNVVHRFHRGCSTRTTTPLASAARQRLPQRTSVDHGPTATTSVTSLRALSRRSTAERDSRRKVRLRTSPTNVAWRVTPRGPKICRRMKARKGNRSSSRRRLRELVLRSCQQRRQRHEGCR